MPDEDARLQAIGIDVIGDEIDPRVRAECIRVAQRLRDEGPRVIGLLPANDDAAVPPIAVQLGVALVEISGATVAYVDANVRQPAISAIVGAEHRGDESMFATRWLRGSLALLTPPRAGAAGAGVPQLERLLTHGTELFAYVLVDLTGFDRLGEHLAAIDLVDTVLVVGRAGATSENELLRQRLDLPADRTFGVLLIG